MEERQARSRAEPPPSRRFAIVLGAVFVLGVAVWGVVTLLRVPPAPIPNGLVGLRFGMTEAEIKAQFPDVKDVDGSMIRETVAFDQKASCRLELSAAQTLQRIECHTSAADDDAMRAALGKALALARSLYGKESEARAAAWVWNGSRSVLEIRADAPQKRLVIEARSTRVP